MELETKMKTGKHTRRQRVPSNINNVNNRKNAFDSIDPSTVYSHWLWFCLPSPRSLFIANISLSVHLSSHWLILLPSATIFLGIKVRIDLITQKFIIFEQKRSEFFSSFTPFESDGRKTQLESIHAISYDSTWKFAHLKINIHTNESINPDTTQRIHLFVC